MRSDTVVFGRGSRSEEHVLCGLNIVAGQKSQSVTPGRGRAGDQTRPNGFRAQSRASPRRVDLTGEGERREYTLDMHCTEQEIELYTCETHEKARRIDNGGEAREQHNDKYVKCERWQ